MAILYKFYRLLSPRMRLRVKSLVGGVGHHVSLLDSLKANKDAVNKRRLDEAFCHFLEIYCRVQNKSLEGLRCLDFGAGYVITDSLVMWLLGAIRVDTVDYNAISRSSALCKAVQCMDEARLLSFAKQFGFIDQHDLTERLTLLKDMARQGEIPLDQLGIHYHSPFDATNDAQVDRLGTIDLVWSTSVLEHIHPKYLSPILNNLVGLLSPWGVMVHLIDARDHLDLNEEPFGFFAENTDYVLDRDFDARGNRLLRKDWERICEDIPGVDARITALDDAFKMRSPCVDQRAHFYLLRAKRSG